MYPFFDYEGQIALWDHVEKWLERERTQGSFFATFLAAILAATITPTILWLAAVAINMSTVG